MLLAMVVHAVLRLYSGVADEQMHGMDKTASKVYISLLADCAPVLMGWIAGKF